MNIVFPYWQNGMLVEGFLLHGEAPSEIYVGHTPTMLVIRWLTLQSQPDNYLIPKTRYLLSWVDADNNIAYYRIAPRWRG